jgi:hypothetical protein
MIELSDSTWRYSAVIVTIVAIAMIEPATW